MDHDMVKVSIVTDGEYRYDYTMQLRYVCNSEALTQVFKDEEVGAITLNFKDGSAIKYERI